jgi:hypothetical protein
MMHDIRNILRCLPLTAMLVILAQPAWAASVTPEDQKLIDAAGCDEIVKQYNIHVAQEKAVAEEIKRTTGGTVATNVVGAATLAAFGFGFFTWDNSVDAEENLAELRVYRDAIAAAGRKKGCAVPAK